ncbi:hypothetical protein PIB30_103406, partial [Stylosanthes scabra]|nr:hypothetical protein [Stylosanthes scabra]
AAPRDYGMERRDREHRTKQIFMGMSMVSGGKLHCKLWRNPESLLARRESECIQGWESSNRYRSMMIDAIEYGHFWRREALEKREDVEELKRKYAQASESITNFIPSFVNQFEKAKE